eukprot:Sdes_comp18322_c0_seq1m8045
MADHEKKSPSPSQSNFQICLEDYSLKNSAQRSAHDGNLYEGSHPIISSQSSCPNETSSQEASSRDPSSSKIHIAEHSEPFFKNLFHKKGSIVMRRGSAPNLNSNRRTSHGSPHPFRLLISKHPSSSSSSWANRHKSEEIESKEKEGSAKNSTPMIKSTSGSTSGEANRSPHRHSHPMKFKSHSWVHSSSYQSSRVKLGRDSENDGIKTINIQKTSQDELKEIQQLNKREYSNHDITSPISVESSLHQEYIQLISSLTNIPASHSIKSLAAHHDPSPIPKVGSDEGIGSACPLLSMNPVALNRGSATIQDFIDEVGVDGDMESDSWYHCSTVRDLEVFRKRFTQNVDCIRERKYISGNLHSIINLLTDLTETRRNWDPLFLEARVIETLDSNSRIIYFKYKTPFLFRPRDFVVLECNYFDETTGIHYTLMNSTTHADIPETTECMRGTLLVSGFMIKKDLISSDSHNLDSHRSNDHVYLVTLLWQVDYKYHVNHIFGDNTSRKDKKFQVNEYDSKLLALERMISVSSKDHRVTARERSESGAIATRLRLLLSMLPGEEEDEQDMDAAGYETSGNEEETAAALLSDTSQEVQANTSSSNQDSQPISNNDGQ